MKIKIQALRLALMIEASTFLVFFISISRAATDVLFAWFIILNIPTILLFRSHSWEFRGRDAVFSPVVIPIFVIQTGVWYFAWYGLIWAFRKLKSKWSHRHDV
jgi:hypothetical protein